MSNLRYVGPDPTTDRELLRKLGTDAGFGGGVSAADLDTKVTTAVNPLALTDVVNADDNGRASRDYVDTQDAKSVPSTAKGAANGVASLDASSRIPLAQIPTGSVPRSLLRGPYGLSLASTIEEAYWDGSGQWDKFIGSITIPAPGGSGLWRPICLGRFEVYNWGGAGRADIRGMVGSYELFRARGRNGGADQPYGVTLTPQTDTSNQTPGGWAVTSGLTINFYLQAPFENTRVGLAGANSVVGYAVRI